MTRQRDELVDVLAIALLAESARAADQDGNGGWHLTRRGATAIARRMAPRVRAVMALDPEDHDDEPPGLAPDAVPLGFEYCDLPVQRERVELHLSGARCYARGRARNTDALSRFSIRWQRRHQAPGIVWGPIVWEQWEDVASWWTRSRLSVRVTFSWVTWPDDLGRAPATAQWAVGTKVLRVPRRVD